MYETPKNGTTRGQPREGRPPNRNLLEGLDRRRLVISYVENRIELSDLQQIVDLLGQVQQLQFATLVFHRGVGADQFADARAVNVVDVAQVEQDLLLTLREQVLYCVSQYYTASAQSDPPPPVHIGASLNLPSSRFQ